MGMTSDLFSFMLGYSVGDTIADRHQGPQSTGLEDDPSRDSKSNDRDTKHETDLLQYLINEIMDSRSRADLLESQTPFVKGPVGPILRDQDTTTTHRYQADDFDCSKFQEDVMAFAESFKVLNLP